MGLHWSNSPEGSATSAGREFTGYKVVNEAIFIVTGGFFLVGIVPVLVFGGNRGGLAALILIGPLAVIALAAWGAPRIAYAKVIEKDPRCVHRAKRNHLPRNRAPIPFLSEPAFPCLVPGCDARRTSITHLLDHPARGA